MREKKLLVMNSIRERPLVFIIVSNDDLLKYRFVSEKNSTGVSPNSPALALKSPPLINGYCE